MMQRGLIVLLVCLISCGSSLAAPRELTVFADGILAELEATAKKGVVDLTLPGQIREGSLRVKPLDNGSIGVVELLPARVPDKLQKELDSLTEQKSRLQDRMKALDHREGIFAAAAKSQSSKAPRKTKTNPDPLTSVRQGTDFAIAQLEAVYTARRRTEQELKRVEARLDSLQKKGITGPTVRVTVTPVASRIRIAAVLKDGGWTPRYELRLQGNGRAQLALVAVLNGLPEGFAVKVAPGSLASGLQQPTYPLPSGASRQLAEWMLQVEQEQITNSPLPSFTFNLKNTSDTRLQPGQAAVYAGGEFIGTIPFPALPAGASISLSGPPVNQKAGPP